MKAQSWLWPDHNIGKRESRRLREEHNALVNSHAELLEALKVCQDFIANSGLTKIDAKAKAAQTAYLAAISKAEGK